MNSRPTSVATEARASAAHEPAAPVAAAPPPAPRVVVGEDSLDLLPHRAAWEGLAASIGEVNPFYEPWMLLPALSTFGADSDLLFLLVYAPASTEAEAPEQLIGFFPLERVRRYRGLPCSALRLWQHLHCFDCTPLIRPGCADLALRALLDWLATHRLGAPLLEMPLLAVDSVFYQALADFTHANDTPRHTLDEHNRALLRPRASGDAYLSEALPTKRRKEFERLERRLAETGRLEHTVLADGDDLSAWVAEFLALEASGWKGKEGSALGQSGDSRAFFDEAVRAARQQGRLLLTALRVDGRAVAMKCSFRTGAGSYAFKIAFDESFAKYSPGVLLEIDNIRRLHARPELRWMDSCAIPRHEMINRLWIDRRTMHSQLLATGRRGSHLLLALVPLMKWFKGLFRRKNS